MDWNAIQQYLPLYQKAAVLTVRLGVAGIIFAIIIGLACAVIQYDKVPVLRQIVGVYIQLSRNTPLLVQLFFIYYGLPKVGIRTNAEICGIAGLAFLGGSYMAEAFRSGLEAIEPIQTLKTNYLGSRNPRLHTDEILIALSSSAAENETAAVALQQLSKLKGCDMHSTVILSSVDTDTIKRLGMYLTCEPAYEQEDRKYHKK